MAKDMSYKKDPTETKIDEIVNSTKTKPVFVYVLCIPVVLCLFLYFITGLEMFIYISLIFLLLAIISCFSMISKNIKGKAIIKELRARKMDMDGNYAAKMKILSNYNSRFSYGRYSVLIVSIMFMFVTMSFSNTLSSDGYYIDKTTIQLLIMIPILIFMVIRIIKSAVKLDKLIIEVFKPSLIPNKKIDYLFDSNLYEFLDSNKDLYIEENYGFVYEDEKRKITIYTHKNNYDMSEYKMYFYNVFDAKIIFGKPDKKTENNEKTLLFIFDKPDFLYNIKIVNIERFSTYEDNLNIPYEVELNGYYLFPEVLKALEDIYKTDVVDISTKNGKVYIKKYLPKIINKEDVEKYLENASLYKKFVDTLK